MPGVELILEDGLVVVHGNGVGRAQVAGQRQRLGPARDGDHVGSRLRREARHVFVGLGNLSRAEEKLIRLLIGAGRAEVHFDADPFYLEADSPNRAGQHLRRYWQKWDLPRDGFTLQEHLRAQLAAGNGAGLERVFGNAQRARHQWITAIEAAEAPPSQDKAE